MPRIGRAVGFRVAIPPPSDRYNRDHEAERNEVIEAAFRSMRPIRGDLYVVPPDRLVLQSPDGVFHEVKVDNAGVLSTTVL